MFIVDSQDGYIYHQEGFGPKRLVGRLVGSKVYGKTGGGTPLGYLYKDKKEIYSGNDKVGWVTGKEIYFRLDGSLQKKPLDEEFFKKHVRGADSDLKAALIYVLLKRHAAKKAKEEEDDDVVAEAA